MLVRMFELPDVIASSLRSRQTLVHQYYSPRLGSQTQGDDAFDVRSSGLLRWVLANFLDQGAFRVHSIVWIYGIMILRWMVRNPYG